VRGPKVSRIPDLLGGHRTRTEYYQSERVDPNKDVTANENQVQGAARSAGDPFAIQRVGDGRDHGSGILGARPTESQGMISKIARVSKREGAPDGETQFAGFSELSISSRRKSFHFNSLVWAVRIGSGGRRLNQGVARPSRAT
jgi:hypothetical protein